MNKSIRSFEDLECWKIGREIRKTVSELTKQFPKEETYGLSQHIKKTGRSITNNIAEGYGRFHFQENIQFCRISRGSAYEILDQLMEARDEEFITKDVFIELKDLINNFLRVLNGYINYLKRANSDSKAPLTNNN
jgi:four helix bundle protein